MMPRTENNFVLKAYTSLEFSVIVTVQSVNHYYRHSPPSAPASFQFPAPPVEEFNDTDFRSVPEIRNDSLVITDDDGEYEYNFRGAPKVKMEPATNEKSGSSATKENSSSSALTGGLIAGIVVMTILVVGLLLLFCIGHKRQRATCKQQPRPLTPQSVVVVAPKEPPSPPETKTKSCQTFDHSFYVVKCRRRTPISCLRRDYEDRLRPNGHYAMKAEFERVPSGPTDTVDDARCPLNAALNRSRDVLPYDKNRVRLTRGRLADRTYINASLIRTVCHQPSIIVTQCPTEDTVGEFWKMVWDFNIGSVVMLVPCDCRQYTGPVYWPRQTEQPTVYSDVEVELLTETARAHFALRRFRLHGWEGECVASRLVSHWQYLRWARGCGLPHHPVQFLDFLRDFQTKHSPDTGMLVHCTLGAGCSGIFLAIDALSTDGRKTGQVDVEECATLLCLERMNLVQTFRQYRYIYYCLIELFDTGHDTCIPVSCFRFAYTNLIQRGKKSGLSHLDHEFCVLAFKCFGLHSHKCDSWKKPCGNRNDNTNNDSPKSVANDDTVSVLDGYRTCRLYLIPRSGVQFAAEFWKAVLDHNARTAVVLRPLEQSGLSIPCEGACSSVGEFFLECKKVRQNPDRSFLVYNLAVARQSSVSSEDVANGQRVRLYEFLAWPDAVELPEVGRVLDLVSNMAEWSRRDCQSRSTLFHVSHSPTDESRAAIVCAIWTALDRIRAENFVDVYMAARYVSSFISSAFASLVRLKNSL